MPHLYNNIVIPDNWETQANDNSSYRELDVPYLRQKPEIIDISVGRQLFVDDFLIRSTDLTRKEHRPICRENNPVFQAETVWEKGIPERDYEKARPSAAILFSGGLWYDGEADLFRMWYNASFHGSIAYAESKDGIHFTRVETDLYEHSNLVIPRGGAFPDTCAVVMNRYGSEAVKERYVMSVYMRPSKGERVGMNIFTSDDGVHWTLRCHTAGVGDTSNIHFNPFLNKWIYSIKEHRDPLGRQREYSQCDSPISGRELQDRIFWLRADEKDILHPRWQCTPQMYVFNAVAYESVMLGAMDIFKGPENALSMQRGLPKITEIHLCYSRDGYHYSRQTDRTPFLGASEQEGAWDRGYLHASNTICTIEGDQLVFRYSAFRGDATMIDPQCEERNGMYAHGSIGIATLRRDGFASMDGCGSLTTEKVMFRGKYLFINAASEDLRAEVLDAAGQTIAGYEMENCISFTGDSCKTLLTWKNRQDLAELSGKPVMLRFSLKSGSFYAFWMSEYETGESGGYLAGGEKGKRTLQDVR